MNRLILVLCFALAFMAGVLTGVLMADPTGASTSRRPPAGQLGCSVADGAEVAARGADEPIDPLDEMPDTDEPTTSISVNCGDGCGPSRRQGARS